MPVPGIADGRLTPSARLVFRVGGVFCIVGSVVWLGLAVFPLRTGGDTRIPVPAAAAVELPSSGGFFGRTLVLYGRNPNHDFVADADLGCTVRDGAGEEMSRPRLYTLAALGGDDRPVDGQSLTPLGEVSRFEKGWRLACTGPAAAALQPLYLLDSTQRAVPRWLAVSFAGLFLAVGTVALGASRTFRPDRRTS